MRLFSTPDSAEAGEVSCLAVVETLCAVSVVILLASKTGTLFYLGVWSLLG
jgi:hypothetical protein